jgi:hypothetical protein
VHVMEEEANVVPAGTGTVTRTFSATEGPLFVTVEVSTRALPAATVAGALLVVRLRSLDRVTLAETACVSFAALPSTEAELTKVTVDDCVAPSASVDDVVKMTVKVLLPPLATDVVVHWILFVRSEQPRSEPAGLKVAPLGLVMSTTTLLASAGPPFVTIALSVRSAPASTEAAVKADVMTDRSL